MRKVASIFISTIMILAILLSSAGCGGQNTVSNSSSDKKVTVYTSFYTMYDFTKKIGGDKINVTNLVPAGTEPHDWEPSTKDIKDLENADVLIYNGAGMEHWAEKVLNTLKNKKLVAVETTKGLQLLENEHHHDHDKEHSKDNKKDEKKEKDHEEMELDPHVWLNPLLAKKQMEKIKEALVSVDQANKDYYEKNFSDNARKLDELDKEFKDAVSKFKKKEIVVSHEAFGYLCDAYGLKQVAIEGLSAESEPSPGRMAEIVKFARENNIKVIFFEELVSPKIAQTIAKEVNAKTEVLNPLEGLDDEGVKAGKDYFSVMRENLQALKKALE